MASVAAGKSFQQQDFRYLLMELLVNRFSNKIIEYLLMELLVNRFSK